MLKAYRIKENKTQQEMADELGIGVSTYNQYENGLRNIPNNIVEKIIDMLKIDKNIFLPTKFTISKSIEDGENNNG